MKERFPARKCKWLWPLAVQTLNSQSNTKPCAHFCLLLFSTFRSLNRFNFLWALFSCYKINCIFSLLLVWSLFVVWSKIFKIILGSHKADFTSNIKSLRKKFWTHLIKCYLVSSFEFQHFQKDLGPNFLEYVRLPYTHIHFKFLVSLPAITSNIIDGATTRG